MTRRAQVPERSSASSAEPTTRSSGGQETAVGAITLKRASDLAGQAAFQWVSRAVVARSSAVTFEVLARVDDRLSTLISALSKRPGLAERFLEDQPAAFPSGHTFVTAAVALRSGAVGVFEALVKDLESRDELLPPLASALAWFQYEEVNAWVKHLLASEAPTAVRLGLLAAVAHRVNPGAPLNRALDAEDPRLRGTALEAAGRLGARAFAPRLRAALEDEDVMCRFWGAWSTVRFGDGAGLSVLGRFASEGGPLGKPACDMVLRALDPVRAVHAHARLASVNGDKRLGVLAAGIIGDPALAEWLLGEMASPAVARPAGAAFCLMTGCDLRRNDLDADRPPAAPDPEVVPPDESVSDGATTQEAPRLDDSSLAEESDDDLAWPDLVKLPRWWDSNRHAFVPGTRYLSGLPIRQAEMVHVLRQGNQQQRAAAALELALLDPETPVMDVTGPAQRQTRLGSFS